MLTFSTTAANTVIVDASDPLVVDLWRVHCQLERSALTDELTGVLGRQLHVLSVEEFSTVYLLYLKLTVQTKELETFVR